MADLLNVSRTTYRNWEDETEPSLTIIKSIAEKLEVPAITLLQGIIDISENNLIEEYQAQYTTKPGTTAIILKDTDLEKVRESLRILHSVFLMPYRADEAFGGAPVEVLPLGKRQAQDKDESKDKRSKR